MVSCISIFRQIKHAAINNRLIIRINVINDASSPKYFFEKAASGHNVYDEILNIPRIIHFQGKMK
jgi:hypothetical protein